MRLIPLRGQGGSLRAYATVDDPDFDWLNRWRWHLNTNGYAVRHQYLGGGRSRTIRMHRLIAKAPIGHEVDHINRNRLDNRRANLRVLPDRFAQMQNLPSHRDSTSRFRGVSWDRRRQRWAAQASLAGQHVFLGYYLLEDQAAAAAAAWRAQHMPYAVPEEH